jgi:hypothetical protein
MTKTNVKTTILRAPSAVAAMRADEKKRLVSEDGLRWATNRWVKRKLPDNRWEPCESWTLREREFGPGRGAKNGHAVIVASGMSEAFARAFVGGAA